MSCTLTGSWQPEESTLIDCDALIGKYAFDKDKLTVTYDDLSFFHFTYQISDFSLLLTNSLAQQLVYELRIQSTKRFSLTTPLGVTTVFTKIM